VKLGGKAPGPMPEDGRAYVVIGGKWVEVAHDGADGVPPRLDLPDKKGKARAPLR
jgi:hypothetical protein